MLTEEVGGSFEPPLFTLSCKSSAGSGTLRLRFLKVLLAGPPELSSEAEFFDWKEERPTAVKPAKPTPLRHDENLDNFYMGC